MNNDKSLTDSQVLSTNLPKIKQIQSNVMGLTGISMWE